MQAQKSKNTQYKTKSDLNTWKVFCESLKVSRTTENIPANELDLFFISVRKQDGTSTNRTGAIKQGHPTDCFGRISVRKTCNRLKFSVREMSSRAFLIKIN